MADNPGYLARSPQRLPTRQSQQQLAQQPQSPVIERLLTHARMDELRPIVVEAAKQRLAQHFHGEMVEAAIAQHAWLNTQCIHRIEPPRVLWRLGLLGTRHQGWC
jgi:hypothetical protein